MSKRIILSIALSLGLALSLSSSAFAKMEDKDAYFGGSAKEASVEFVQMRIRGTLTEMPSTTLPTTLALTSGGKTYLVDIASSTVIVRLYNGKSNLTEFTLGDDLEVLGTPTDTGSIKAKILKNRSISFTNTKGVFGNIKSIDAANNAFVFTWKDKDYNVKVDADTKIMIPGIKNKAAIADLKVGDRAQGRAVYNSSTQIYLAKNIIVVRRDGVDLLKKKAKTVNKEGALLKIESTTLPTVIEGKAKDGKTYKINVTDKTVIVRKHFGKSSLSEFKAGDKIRVVGSLNSETMTIDAKMLKNDSLKSLDELKVDTDQDGIADARDGKLNDHDNDGTIDADDADDDNDGIADKKDKKKFDHDNDGIKDKKDNDDDNDGIADSSEATGKQFDHDNDGKRDDKDDDDDNDGINDGEEIKGQELDRDNDGIKDDQDIDGDNDGILDTVDGKLNDNNNDGIEENKVTRITYHTARDGFPSISGNKIIWERSGVGNMGLYMYDLSTGTEKIIRKLAEASAISGDRIAFNTNVYDSVTGGYIGVIRVYDLSTDNEYTVTPVLSFINKGEMRGPRISGDKIVWLEYGDNSIDVFLYDLTLNIKKQLTNDSVDQLGPVVSGNKVVWQQSQDGNDWDIYLYDVLTNKEQRIAKGVNPSISGNKIVYEKSIVYGGVSRTGIYLYDLLTNTEHKIWSSEDYSGLRPVISGDLVVWIGEGGILIHNLKTNRKSKISTSAERLSISENKIVWMSGQNPNHDIYFYEYRY